MENVKDLGKKSTTNEFKKSIKPKKLAHSLVLKFSKLILSTPLDFHKSGFGQDEDTHPISVEAPRNKHQEKIKTRIIGK